MLYEMKDLLKYEAEWKISFNLIKVSKEGNLSMVIGITDGIKIGEYFLLW